MVGLYLRKLIGADVKEYLAIMNDPVTLYFSGSLPPVMDETWALKRLSEKEELGLFDQGVLIGACGHFEKEGKREISYSIGPTFRGCGYATKTVRLLLDHMQESGIKGPVYAGVAKENIGSLKVLSKNGFKIVREDTYFSRGRGAEVASYYLEGPRL